MISGKKTDRNIFVTNYSGHNLKAAEKYLEGNGKIHYITEGKVNIFLTESLERQIRYALKDMQPDDLILIAGNSTIAAVTLFVVSDMFQNVNILVWNYNEGRSGDYALRILKSQSPKTEGNYNE